MEIKTLNGNNPDNLIRKALVQIESDQNGGIIIDVNGKSNSIDDIVEKTAGRVCRYLKSDNNINSKDSIDIVFMDGDELLYVLRCKKKQEG